MMYFWFYEIEADDENYWEKYLSKIIISLE